MQILNLEPKDSMYHLDTKKQGQVTAGLEKDNVVGGNGAKNSVMHELSISLNGEMICNLNHQPFGYTLVFNRTKVDFNSDPINQIITSGNARVWVGGENYSVV